MWCIGSDRIYIAAQLDGWRAQVKFPALTLCKLNIESLQLEASVSSFLNDQSRLLKNVILLLLMISLEAHNVFEAVQVAAIIFLFLYVRRVGRKTIVSNASHSTQAV